MARVVEGADYREADRWLTERGVDVAFALEPLSDIARIEAALDGGYRVTDVRLTLARPPGEVAQGDPRVRSRRPSDLGPLQDIAARAHRDSRFYADRHFPRDMCDELYRTWLRNAFADDTATVLVSAGDDDEPVGYVVVRPDGDSPRMDLLGVAENAQRQGRGRGLVNAALARSSGPCRITVVTQGRNVTAQALYQSCGFRSWKAELWLHRWMSVG